jgi:hypothetical protein
LCVMKNTCEHGEKNSQKWVCCFELVRDFRLAAHLSSSTVSTNAMSYYSSHLHDQQIIHD